MARTRSIKPEFWDDEKLAKLSRDIRLLFIGTWKCADDFGVCKGNPFWMRSQIFPYDDIPIATFSEWMSELEQGGFLVPFTANGESYYYIRNFSKHQKIDHPSPSRNPRPPEEITNGSPGARAQFAKDSRMIREEFRKTSPQTETETETETEKEPATDVAVSPGSHPPSENAFHPEAVMLAGRFVKLMQEHMPEIMARMKNGYLADWQAVFDRLIRTDNRDPAEISQLVEHCFNGERSWWARTRNIRSPVKLRKRNPEGVYYYDVILEEMRNAAHQTNSKGYAGGGRNPAPYGDGKPVGFDIIANIDTDEFIANGRKT